MTNKSILLLLLLTLTVPRSYADAPLTITSGRGEPFVNKTRSGFYDQIVKSMFQRIGIKATTIQLPSERSLISANSGFHDGNIARIKGIEKKYTRLVMVPEKIIDFDFVAFTRNTDFSIHGWKSLAPYNVAFINGWKLFEKKVKYYKSLVRTRNSDQLFKLLNKGRADVVLYDLWSGIWWINKNNSRIHYLQPPIATYQLYLYVNKKHQGLVPALTHALKSMKQDGTYQRIYNKTLNTLHD